MHQSVINWVRDNHHLWHSLRCNPILELGSLDVNGTVRDYVPQDALYIGLDITPGPSVDIQATAWHIPFPDSTFDLVICCEMLEHDLLFWNSLAEANRVLNIGGDLIVTARGIDFPPHDHPYDYYRFTVDSMLHLLPMFGFKVIRVEPDSQCPGVLALAYKWSDLTE